MNLPIERAQLDGLVVFRDGRRYGAVSLVWTGAMVA
jgi:hypothetical protein